MTALTPEQRESARKRSRKSYLKNKEKVLARSHARYAANKELILYQTAAYAKAHPEVVQKSCRKYREKNIEVCRFRNRRYYADNIEQQRARGRAKGEREYAENREAVLERNRRWRFKNKDKIRSRDMRRRALLRGAEVNLLNITEWIVSVRSRKTFKCYYCEKRFPIFRIHFDHIIALSKGGPHSVENLCTSCDHCNLSKGAKPLSEWVENAQQLLPI